MWKRKPVGGGGNTVWKNTVKQPVSPKSQWPKYAWTCSQLENALPDKDIYFIHPCLFFCIDFLETKMLLAGFWHRNFSFINICWKYLIDLVIGHGGPDDSVCVLIFSTISSFLFHLLLIFFCYSKTQFSISLIQTHNCLCWPVTIGRGTEISTHTNMNKLSSSKMPYHTTNYNYVSPERRKNHLKTHRNGSFLSWLKSRAFYGRPHWKKRRKESSLVNRHTVCFVQKHDTRRKKTKNQSKLIQFQ